MNVFKRMIKKEDPAVYQDKDAKLPRVLTVKDFLALGVGTIVSTTIFTLPGVVAAQHAGPAVALSCLLAAIVGGLVAFAYAEMAAAMPFAGSAYSWINVVFGEVFGWIAGWRCWRSISSPSLLLRRGYPPTCAACSGRLASTSHFSSPIRWAQRADSST